MESGFTINMVIKVSKIQNIIISMEELTDNEQMELWYELWVFVTRKLPQATTLKVFIVSKPLDVKQEGGNGLPPTDKSVGIRPTTL